MTSKPVVLVALVLIGCSKSPTSEEAESARVLLERRQWASEIPKNVERTKAKHEVLKVRSGGGRKRSRKLDLVGAK